MSVLRSRLVPLGRPVHLPTLGVRHLHSTILRRTTTPSSSPYPQPGTKKPFWRRRPIIFTCLISPIVVTGSLGLVLGGLLAFDASTSVRSLRFADRSWQPIGIKLGLFKKQS